MQEQMSKNRRRRLRREEYYRCLEASLAEEGHFVRRVVATIDHRGLDIAPDGRPIKAGFWGLISQRQAEAGRARSEPEQRKLIGSSLACLDLVERAVRTVAVTVPRRRISQGGVAAGQK
jgi:hypothetical protein